MSPNAVSVLVTIACLVGRCAASGLVLTNRLEGCLSRVPAQLRAQIRSDSSLQPAWASRFRVARSSMTLVHGSAAEAAKHCVQEKRTNFPATRVGEKKERINAPEGKERTNNLILSHNSRTAGRKTGWDPSKIHGHEQLNNSSCISASQGILSRARLIGQTAARAMRTPVLSLGSGMAGWVGSR